MQKYPRNNRRRQKGSCSKKEMGANYLEKSRKQTAYKYRQAQEQEKNTKRGNRPTSDNAEKNRTTTASRTRTSKREMHMGMPIRGNAKRRRRRREENTKAASHHREQTYFQKTKTAKIRTEETTKEIPETRHHQKPTTEENNEPKAERKHADGQQNTDTRKAESESKNNATGNMSQ